MKRIWILLLALAAGCTAGPGPTTAGTGSTPAQKPPALTVRVGEGEASATLGTYSWTWPNGNGTDTGVEADGPHPLDMLDYMTSLPFAGERAATLRFDLGGLALDRMTLRRWALSSAGDPTGYESDFETLPFAVTGGTVTVDLLDGRGGIFEVHAYFTGESHGDGYYAFCLQSGIEGDASVRVKMI